jgi:hypothetical protein
MEQNEREIRETEIDNSLEVEAVDFSDIDAIEESFSPASQCGCGCFSH